MDLWSVWILWFFFGITLVWKENMLYWIFDFPSHSNLISPYFIQHSLIIIPSLNAYRINSNKFYKHSHQTDYLIKSNQIKNGKPLNVENVNSIRMCTENYHIHKSQRAFPLLLTYFNYYNYFTPCLNMHVECRLKRACWCLSERAQIFSFEVKLSWNHENSNERFYVMQSN